MKKSLIVQIITILILVIGAYSGYFTSTTQAWLGVISFAATITLSTFAPSGVWVKGWSTTSLIVNIAGALVQAINVISENDLVNPQILNGFIIGLNLIIQYIGRDYPKVVQIR